MIYNFPPYYPVGMGNSASVGEIYSKFGCPRVGRRRDSLSLPGGIVKILIVYTHPITASFNAAMLDAVSEELVNASHTIKIADLYSEQFQPAMIVEDFAQFENIPMPADVLAEQERIEWCDAIVFIFPIWW